MTRDPAEAVRRAAAVLRRGGVVAYPTETCYGLGVRADDPAAVERLRRLKGRAASNPVSILVLDADWVPMAAGSLSPLENALLSRYWPGPLTLLADPQGGSPFTHLAAPRLGLRCSSHPTARLLVETFGAPITSTSANRSQEPPLNDAEAIRNLFGDEVCVLENPEPPGPALVSTVAAVDGGRIEILREGVIPAAELFAFAERWKASP